MGAFVKIEKKEKEKSAQNTVASGKKGSFVQVGDTSAIGKMEGASFGPKTETKTETKKATIAKTGTELISDTKRKYGSYTTKKQAAANAAVCPKNGETK